MNKNNGLTGLIRILTITLAATILAACGGGGGGDSGGGGGGGTSLQLSATSVTFTAFANEASPESKTIQVTWSGSRVAGYVVGTLPGQGLPPWLSVSGQGTSSPSTVTISRMPTSMPAGHYSTTLRVVTGDVNQTVLNTADFTVSLDVVNVPAITPSSVTFAWEESAQAPAQTLNVAHDSQVQLQGATVDVNWLAVSTTADAITLTPNAQALARPIGTSSGTLTATVSLNGNPRRFTVPISSIVTAHNGGGLQVSAGSVAFATFNANSAADPKTLQVSWTDPRVAGYIVDAAPGNGLPTWLEIFGTQGSANPSSVTLARASTSLSVGHYSTTLRVRTLDAKSVVVGISNIDVTLDVVDMPTITPQSIALSWVESEQPATRTLTVTHGSSMQLSGASVDANWLGVSTSADTITLSGNAQSKLRGPGTGSATLTATFSVGGTQLTTSVPVSSTVSRALSSSTTLINLQVNASTVAADLSATRATVTSATTTPLQLSAQSNVPWLTVTGGSSANASNIALAIDSMELAQLADGIHHATITASATNVTPLAIPVDLNVRLPEVHFVAPVAFTDTVASEEVIVRGQGFNDPGVRFQIDSQLIVGGTLVSDTEFRFVAGARAAGSYTVLTRNQLGLARSTAPLRVTAPPAYTNFTLSAPYGAPERIISSPINSVVFADRCYFCTSSGPPGTASKVYRYAYDSGSGNWSVAAYDYPQLFDIALSPDESVLIVLTTGQLLIVDPQSMTTLKVINLPGGGVGGTSRELGVINSGLILIGGLQRAYDLVTKTFVPVNNLVSDQIDASVDGTRAMNGAATNDGNIAYRYFDASLGSFVVTNTFEHYARGRYSRHATRAMVNSNLFDQNLALLGVLPITSHSSAVSPDGTRVYGVDLNISNNTNNFRTFDITGLAPFTELAPMSINITGISRTEVDTRGNAVFVIDDANFRVIDLP